VTETIKQVNKTSEKRTGEAKSSRFSFILSLCCTLLYIDCCGKSQTVAPCTNITVIITNTQTSLFTPLLSKFVYDFKTIVRGITQNTLYGGL
jgi:hypothetical protein